MTKEVRIKLNHSHMATLSKDKAAVFKVGDLKIYIQLESDVVLHTADDVIDVQVESRRDKMN